MRTKEPVKATSVIRIHLSIVMLEISHGGAKQGQHAQLGSGMRGIEQSTWASTLTHAIRAGTGTNKRFQVDDTILNRTRMDLASGCLADGDLDRTAPRTSSIQDKSRS